MTSTQRLLLEHRIDAMKREYADRVMDESGHQQFLFRLLKKEEEIEPLLRWVHSVPNGSGLLAASTAGRLKGEGLKPGVFDINFDVARGKWHGLKIELKTPKIYNAGGTIQRRAGVPSTEQLEWQAHYHQQGYCAVICYGWRSAYDHIKAYLEAQPPA